MMILVYSPKITSRINYICELLLGSLLAADWQLTKDTELFLGHEGPKISYSKNRVHPEALHIHAHGFLNERGVRSFQPGVSWKNKLPQLFPQKEECDLGFDLFAAAFYLVSRYEEYLPHEKDIYGRFEAAVSFSSYHNFLQTPVVNQYALLIESELKKRFPSLKFKKRVFTFIPTYDIDVAFAYRGRGFLRSALGVLRSLWTFDTGAVTERFRVITGKTKDPFDTYDYQLSLSRQSGIRAFYFILCGDYGRYDKNIAFYSRSFFSLVKRLSDYAYIGLHPSFASHEEGAMLLVEAARLSNILNEEIRYSRQHYLKFSLPKTYQNVLKANLSHDFSMGYASQPGFRAGICSPYYFYDLESESTTPLKIMPLAVMDGTFMHYLKSTPSESFDIIQHIINETERVGGTFISLWHNDSLRRGVDNEAWVSLYEKVYQLAVSKHKKDYDPLHPSS
jgi:hypothetical protein